MVVWFGKDFSHFTLFNSCDIASPHQLQLSLPRWLDGNVDVDETSSYCTVVVVDMTVFAAGEQVSEEEESGVDEDFEPSASAAEDVKLNRTKSDKKKKNAKRTKALLPRLV